MDGVLSFKFSPDYETPDDAPPADNEYKIVVVASDDAPGAGTGTAPTQMGYMKVVVKVTDDEDERGSITLSSLQPQVDAALTATHADPEVDQGFTITWKWERSGRRTSGWTRITSAAEGETYTPSEDDVNNYLRVTATYDDDDDNERSAQAVSANKVRAAPDTGNSPADFPSEPDWRQQQERRRELAGGDCCGQAGGGHRHLRRRADLQSDRRQRRQLHDKPRHGPDHGGS